MISGNYIKNQHNVSAKKTKGRLILNYNKSLSYPYRISIGDEDSSLSIELDHASTRGRCLAAVVQCTLTHSLLRPLIKRTHCAAATT